MSMPACLTSSVLSVPKVEKTLTMISAALATRPTVAVCRSGILNAAEPLQR
jgi:hypothetical protein